MDEGLDQAAGGEAEALRDLLTGEDERPDHALLRPEEGDDVERDALAGVRTTCDEAAVPALRAAGGAYGAPPWPRRQVVFFCPGRSPNRERPRAWAEGRRRGADAAPDGVDHHRLG